jgi:protein-export membrane protein SecD
MLKHRMIAFFIVVIAALVGYFVYSSQSTTPFRLGLDLAGGTELVYTADVSKIPAAQVNDSMTALRDTIERRVNIFGVSEPVVETETAGVFGTAADQNRLIVQLPGVTNVDAAKAAIGATPVLEFYLIKTTAYSAIIAKNLNATDTATAVNAARISTGITGALLSKAALSFDSTTGAPVVSLVFNSDGTKKFADLTKNNIGDIVAIYLDGQPLELPTIREPITTGQAQITGSFTLDQAQSLVRNLNYGALPVPITILSEQTIGPSLGAATVNAGIMAGLIAFVIIGLFLVLWYRLPGLIAVVALAVYTIINLALYKYIPVTLTAAGIAGFILSIGMAVDANILIFERMKEELRSGRSIMDAMHEGFARAWPSIRDSNTSSIITGLILYYFGSTSIVKGFALVFVIGVLVSMFTAITASRFFLFAVAPKKTGRLTLFLMKNGFTR